ncbi:hypothetical protein MAR_012454 [Mya arenaria]|uniref:Uncharacterized protein n=1 Tax=Mya arenaria TaxID=6604 RepID=A0ABY7FX42_MYAAR|nr:hypothetical protein MAR_012454 [Mya arenaria]
MPAPISISTTDRSASRRPRVCTADYDIYFREVGGGIRDYRSAGNRLKRVYQGKPTLVYDDFVTS